MFRGLALERYSCTRLASYFGTLAATPSVVQEEHINTLNGVGFRGGYEWANCKLRLMASTARRGALVQDIIEREPHREPS